MNAAACIRIKRDGGILNESEINAFISGAIHGEWTEGQVSAMLMAICLNGMTPEETAYLTDAMLQSGEVLEYSGIEGSIVDKHSTGGVGDKVSLILAPLAVACGLVVPMISGRGLGHTGGTLDKLESIPGFSVSLNTDQMKSQLEKLGCFLVGQTENLVPADRMLYALRDVTATVESIPLITASILSKKLASGIQGLVMDVKCGRGAFMNDLQSARSLAQQLVQTGTALGTPVSGLITSMENPIGRAIGNAVEVHEAIEILKGNGPDDLRELTVSLVYEMLHISSKEEGSHGKDWIAGKLKDGSALAIFERIIEAQGGDPAIIDKPSKLPAARYVEDVFYEEANPQWVKGIDSRTLALATMELGAGRKKQSDSIDPAVGISQLVQAGEELLPGGLICRIHFSDSSQRDGILHALRNAIALSESTEHHPEMILERLANG